MVKDVRRCSAQAVLGAQAPFMGSTPPPHRSRNICMDYVSTVVEKTSVPATD